MLDKQSAVKVLNDLVQQYYEIDSQAKSIAPQREALNRAIKDLMKELGLTAHVANSIVATCRTQSKTTLNKAKVLQKTQDCGLPDDFFSDCWDISEIQILSVKKV